MIRQNKYRITVIGTLIFGMLVSFSHTHQFVLATESKQIKENSQIDELSASAISSIPVTESAISSLQLPELDTENLKVEAATGSAITVDIPENISVKGKVTKYSIGVKGDDSDFDTVKITVYETVYLFSDTGFILPLKITQEKFVWTKEELSDEEFHYANIWLECEKLIPGRYTGTLTYDIEIEYNDSKT